MNKQKIVRVVSNKFFIVFVLFFVWAGFIDKNNVISLIKNQNELKKLQHEKTLYQSEIISDSTNAANLKNNPDAIEKFGREEYGLKNPNEDVYIIVKK